MLLLCTKFFILLQEFFNKTKASEDCDTTDEDGILPHDALQAILAETWNEMAVDRSKPFQRTDGVHCQNVFLCAYGTLKPSQLL